MKSDCQCLLFSLAGECSVSINVASAADGLRLH